MYDVVIIGGGPSGLSAAIYAGRGGMKTLITEKLAYGGQAALTYEVDNYPGFTGSPSGMELAEKMTEHAKAFGAEFTSENVKEIENADKPVKTIVTRKNRYDTKTIIFATGAKPRELGVEGEQALRGMGVSYCATCDGAFFKGQETAVVGGGNTAFEDALYLARFCTKVYLIHRRDGFRADKVLQDSVMENDKITVLTNTVINKIIGDTTVKSVSLKNLKDGSIYSLDTAAVFVAVGISPESGLAQTVVEVNKDGFIKTDSHMRTNVDGIFAAGDVRDTALRQVVTAASDGAVAASSAISYVMQQKSLALEGVN